MRRGGNLELVNVTKYYGKTLAVKNISFRVNSGEFFTILGPSGCGKTTILKIIAGILKPDSGKILLDGEDITNIPPYERRFGYVFQNYALFPHMTVFENVAFGLKIRKLSKEEIRERVQEALRMVKLEGYENRYPRELSGGEQQRVALARSIALRPPILLLDEPLSNLDAKLREEMRAELKTLQRKLGVTTIYVTHDQLEALSMSDRVCVMSKGKIEQIDRPMEVYRKPKNFFVANFIGEINSFEGKVAEIADSYVKVKIGDEFVFCSRTTNKLMSSERVIVFVRPEDIMVSASPISSDNIFEGKIVNSFYMGDRIQYWIRVRNRLIKAYSRKIFHGNQVYVGWNKESSYILKVE
ncbi:MAG: ABC transporter ATP-binding protein [Thermoprotei archaeon]|nr:MAG: ABC transporter ATP-binding protein [Thermoprotei archaeon]